jgi:hypothetical protein
MMGMRNMEGLLASRCFSVTPLASPLSRSALGGLNDAVATMRERGRRLVFIPPHLGYGRYSDPPNIVGADAGALLCLFRFSHPPSPPSPSSPFPLFS